MKTADKRTLKQVVIVLIAFALVVASFYISDYYPSFQRVYGYVLAGIIILLTIFFVRGLRLKGK
ncbi:MAG: hypothetical protein AAFX87_24010 [Bacteroidota bacterium]